MPPPPTNLLSLACRYHSLSRAMAHSDSTNLLGGQYEALQNSELRAIGSDGTCRVELPREQLSREVRVDAVAVLVGMEPDLQFLPDEVLAALKLEQKPPDVHDGVTSTHPVFVEVDPFSCEAAAWPGLYALGPLRGDNFMRFAIHDAHGAAAAIAARAITEDS